MRKNSIIQVIIVHKNCSAIFGVPVRISEELHELLSKYSKIEFLQGKLTGRTFYQGVLFSDLSKRSLKWRFLSLIDRLEFKFL